MLWEENSFVSNRAHCHRACRVGLPGGCFDKLSMLRRSTDVDSRANCGTHADDTANASAPTGRGEYVGLPHCRVLPRNNRRMGGRVQAVD
jgi:hypothetical protein